MQGCVVLPPNHTNHSVTVSDGGDGGTVSVASSGRPGGYARPWHRNAPGTQSVSAESGVVQQENHATQTVGCVLVTETVREASARSLNGLDLRCVMMTAGQ